MWVFWMLVALSVLAGALVVYGSDHGDVALLGAGIGLLVIVAGIVLALSMLWSEP